MARKESQLILNQDRSIYHLRLQQEDIPPWIITVGDPGRVERVAKHLDEVHFNKRKREFVSCRGRLGAKEILIISSGIGPDNIDIVLNELDALVNIDFESGKPVPDPKQLTFIRIGTTGALQADLPVDATIASSHAMGLDNLLSFYDIPTNDRERAMQQSLENFFKSEKINIPFYLYEASPELVDSLPMDMRSGITLTCPGFYGPQGRTLRMSPKYPFLLDHLRNWTHEQARVTNLEMESAAIFGLAKGMGHRAIAISTVLANRETESFSPDPYAAVDNLIKRVLDWIDSLSDQD